MSRAKYTRNLKITRLCILQLSFQLCASHRGDCVLEWGLWALSGSQTIGYDRLFIWFLQVFIHGLCTVVALYCTWITCTCLHALVPAKNTNICYFAWSKSTEDCSYCTSWVKAASDPWEGQQDSILLLFPPPQDSEHKHPESHMAHAEFGAESCALTSASFTRWSMPRMALGGEGGDKCHPKPRHEHTSHRLDWQQSWTQDVRSGETQLASEDHSLPQPLNPQKGLGTKVSHFLRFSVHSEHTNTCIM